MPRINLSHVSEITAMPEGRYLLSLQSYKCKPAKSSGNMTMYLTFVVTNDENYEGRKVFKNFSLEENALWALKQFLHLIGADEEVLNDPEGFDTEEFMPGLIGSTIGAYLKVQEYPENSGRFNNQIDSFIDPNEMPTGW